ncbi:hypothetical protein [Paracoccus ravus]|uniref:hypothetical protein n=1 Tax=Paracoccus ravus TaxID=2447760 RepID=UPI00106E1079|nr:hypothetical protein [Paracoccus ravus]
MSNANALEFVEAAPLSLRGGVETAAMIEAEGTPPLALDQLPDGVVSGNTLIDYSAARMEVRGGLSLALIFAGRAADAAMKEGDDEQDWFAAYQQSLGKLGFRASQTATTLNRFRKRGVMVHKALVPFLMTALGGVGVGPVIISLLEQIKDMDADRSWITLFDQESRHFSSREMHFAAVSSDESESVIRHVAARLMVENDETNVLFLSITDATAEFESATTTFSANNGLLAVLEEPLKQRLTTDALAFIQEAKL